MSALSSFDVKQKANEASGSAGQNDLEFFESEHSKLCRSLIAARNEMEDKRDADFDRKAKDESQRRK